MSPSVLLLPLSEDPRVWRTCELRRTIANDKRVAYVWAYVFEHDSALGVARARTVPANGVEMLRGDRAMAAVRPLQILGDHGKAVIARTHR